MKHMFYFRFIIWTFSSFPGLLHFRNPSSPRLRVLRVSLIPWLLAFISSSPRLRVLRVSLFPLFPFSRSCPRIPSHSSGQKGKNFINFHFITKSSLKNRYFPFIPALDFVICPKKAKINQARNDCPNQFSPCHPAQMLFARIFSNLSHYIMQSGNSAMYLTRSRGVHGVEIQDHTLSMALTPGRWDSCESRPQRFIPWEMSGNLEQE
jgi:hypothetical protein